MMKQKFVVKALVFCSFTLALLVSCRDTSKVVAPQYLQEKKFPSLFEIYPEMYAKATEWNEDAVLSIIDIEIGTERNDSVAIYENPHDTSRGLLVRYEAKGMLSTKTVEYNYPQSDERKLHIIDMSEVKIDSVDAWAIFIAHPEVLAFDANYFEQISLILIPSDSQREGKNIWRLSIGDENSYDFFHIDAKTGEWLEIDFP